MHAKQFRKLTLFSAFSPFSSSSVSDATRRRLIIDQEIGALFSGRPRPPGILNALRVRRSTHVCPKGEPAPVTNVQANYDFHARVN